MAERNSLAGDEFEARRHDDGLARDPPARLENYALQLPPEVVLLRRGLGGFDPCEHFRVVVAGGPEVAEEIGGVDVAVFREEPAIAAATEHQVRVEFPAELLFFCNYSLPVILK